MQITSADTWILRLPFVRESRDFPDAHHELVGVTLRTGDGETGLGFCFLTDFGGGTSVKALLDDMLLPRVIGRSAMDSARIWHELSDITHRMGHGINSFAIAAIDIALWDLRSRTHGNSLAAELGQVRDRVPAYGSGKGSPTLGIDELIGLQQGYVDEGFGAVKVRVGMSPHEDVRRVAALRAALGDDIRIMCDANERLDLPTAKWLAARLAEHDVYWFEEPLRSDDVQSYAALRQSSTPAIAGGEHLCSVTEFARYIEAGALDVVQPNICMVGGVTPIMQIGALADAHGLGFAPHLFNEFHVHIAAALPRVSYVEYFPWIDAFIEHPLRTEDGDILVPSEPGHGVRFTAETWERYRTA